MICRLDLSEDSPNTLEGSFTKDLLFSKFWLCNLVLAAMKTAGRSRFNSIYVLGSWFGNMFLILKQHDIDFDRIVLVDKDRKCIETSRKIFSGMDSRLELIHGDANFLSYPTNGSDLLIINTSCNDMQENNRWFRILPSGSMVALQSRDDLDTLSKMDQRFPLEATAFLGSRSFSDPEKDYQRLTKVGIK